MSEVMLKLRQIDQDILATGKVEIRGAVQGEHEAAAGAAHLAPSAATSLGGGVVTSAARITVARKQSDPQQERINMSRLRVGIRWNRTAVVVLVYPDPEKPHTK